MTRVLLWDTNVWSHLLLGTPDKRVKVQARLRELAERYPGATRATSRICIVEALVAARRLTDLTAAQAAEAVLAAEFNNPNLIVIEITDRLAGSDVAVADHAATLRAACLVAAAQRGGPVAGPDGGKLKLPDAIIAASCLAFSPPAVLLTEDGADFMQTAADGSSDSIAGLTIESL